MVHAKTLLGKFVAAAIIVALLIVAFRLLAGGQAATGISGYVFIDMDGDRAKDPGEPPVVLMLVKAGANMAVTDGDGYYMLDVPAGAYELYCEDTDFVIPASSFMCGRVTGPATHDIPRPPFARIFLPLIAK